VHSNLSVLHYTGVANHKERSKYGVIVTPPPNILSTSAC
jgi:hypothetical protein